MQNGSWGVVCYRSIIATNVQIKWSNSVPVILYQKISMLRNTGAAKIVHVERSTPTLQHIGFHFRNSMIQKYLPPVRF